MIELPYFQTPNSGLQCNFIWKPHNSLLLHQDVFSGLPREGVCPLVEIWLYHQFFETNKWIVWERTQLESCLGLYTVGPEIHLLQSLGIWKHEVCNHCCAIWSSLFLSSKHILETNLLRGIQIYRLPPEHPSVLPPSGRRPSPQTENL